MKEIILDVRTEREFCKGHVKGAILVETPLPPLSDDAIKTFKSQLKTTIKKECKKKCFIKVYCKKGIRARKAVNLLNEIGYKNVKSLGGVEVNPLLKKIKHGEYDMCYC